MSSTRIIYTRPEDGGLSIIIPMPGFTVEDAAAAVPAGVAYEVVSEFDIPEDRTFREAWFHDISDDPQKVGIDLDEAKDITHARRRAARAAEFAPLDIQATIPAEAAEAEAERQVIRDKYAAIQTEIDAAASPDDLITIIEQEGL